MSDVSTHTLKGVSSLTVRQGDITLFMDVEDFTVEAHHGEQEDVYSEYSMDPIRVFKWSTPDYAIRSSRIVLNDDIAFKVVKKQRAVTRTVSIEIEEWTVAQINEARIATGAPETATPTWVRDSGKQYVEFKWEESV